MGIDTERLRRRERRIKKAQASKTSLMNNTKWCRFFEAIEENPEFHIPVLVKYLGSEELFHPQLNFGISPVKGYSLDRDGGPIEYKAIEWIYVATI